MVFLDITWGETFVLTGLGFALIGRKDLPKAARLLGTQIGKVVGFLQGVRVRADRFADQHELKALHNELRSGLRELDAVRAELATAASSRGLVGRNLSNHHHQQPVVASHRPESSHISDIQEPGPIPLAPRSQSVAAVAEAEWEKQGIGFKSRAEMGLSLRKDTTQGGSFSEKSGSMLLANILQESLIFDQYDRTVREQDQLLQNNVDKILKERLDSRIQNK